MIPYQNINTSARRYSSTYVKFMLFRENWRKKFIKGKSNMRWNASVAFKKSLFKNNSKILIN